MRVTGGGGGWYVGDEIYFPSFLPLPHLFVFSSAATHSCSPTWIPGKSLSHSLGLDTAKFLQLLRFRRDLGSKSNFTNRPLNE